MKRRPFEFAASFACSLVRAGVVLAIAAVSLSWAIGVIDVDGPDSTRAGRTSDASEAAVETTRVRMVVAQGRSCSDYSLEDEQGRELLRVTYVRTGFVNVTLGDAFPVRPGFSAGLDGLYDFVATHDGTVHRLRVRPGGPAGFTIASRSCRIGEYLFDPWTVGQR
jgi:hypothetical protein